MSSTPFGEQLKREREMRGVTIEEISKATRIGTRFLEALERGQWDQLPGGVFNRGFIRSIARYLGLDGDALVAEYELERKLLAEPQPSIESAREEIPRNWRPAVAAIAMFAALVAGGWFAYQRYALESSAHGHNQSVAAGEPIPGIAAPVAAGVGDSTPSVPAATDAATAAVQSGATRPSADVPLELKIQAGKPADVKIIADGKTVFEGHLEIDQQESFTARDSFEVASSESSALFLELNGQTVPPLGTPGEPGHITLTHNDLKPDAGGAH
jgi:cytoskeletal protein RodZ